jgi:uncharacterized membrane protein YphA (DoxX/SURF4 family)
MFVVDPLLLAVRLILAGVFLVAGVGKLLDLGGSRKAVEDFGLSQRLALVVGTGLPLAEIITAIALIPASTAQWGAIAALVLLLCFMGGIANAMRKGEAPDCNCFGQIHSAPAGRGTLIRNGVLAVAGAFVAVAGPGPALGSWVSDRTGAEIVAIVSVTALIGAVYYGARLWQESRGMRRRIETLTKFADSVPAGLFVGAVAPEIAVQGDQDGPPTTLASLRARGLPVALVFIGPSCGPCEVLIPEVVEWQETMSDRVTIAFVGRGVRDRYQAHLEAGGTQEDTPQEIVDAIDELTDVFVTYRIIATPAAVIVSPEGTIASATVDGRLGIQSLIRLTMSRSAPPIDLVPPLQPAA